MRIKNLFMKHQTYYDSTRAEMQQFIPNKIRKLLEIGCGAGNFGAEIKKTKGIEVWGIEPCEDYALKAKNKLDKVLIKKIDDALKELPNQYFDCVVFNDVIEHLEYPEEILRKISNNLVSGGVIIASIPNVRHYGNLFRLLFIKDWQYTESGILDNTHLRFFTKKSIIRMFDNAGYDLVDIKGINGIFKFKWILFYIYTLGFGADTRFPQFGGIFRKKG